MTVSVGEGSPTKARGTAGAHTAFNGFWMGGYEGADHVNGHGHRLDLALSSGHIDRLDEDHRRAAEAGLRCVRESIGWRVSESADGRIDLARAVRIATSARRHGLQVLWTVMHYGVPEGLSLRDDRMITRLARFCAEVARVLAPWHVETPPVYTPINEISFLAWVASQPETPEPPNGPLHMTVGQEIEAAKGSRISGYLIKRRLAQAAILSIKAMKAIDPRSRFLHVEPLIHVVAPHDRPDLAPLAQEVSSWQWQAWDLIAGIREPALGGEPSLLDLLGANHYHSSQWEVESERRLDWAARDPRRRSMSAMLGEAWERYQRPIIVAETSHVGRGRAQCLHEMASEVRIAQAQGVEVHGLCIYPLVDRPDWEEPARWHKSGLWHVDVPSQPPLARYAEPDSMAALQDWRRHQEVARRTAAGFEPPALLVFTHQRWNGPAGRVRLLMEALARRGSSRRLVIVEPPVLDPSRVWLDCIAAGPNLEVLVPHGPTAVANGSTVESIVLVDPEPWLELIGGWISTQALDIEATWLSSPAAWPLVARLGFGPIVYDCFEDFGSAGDGGGSLTALEMLERDLLPRADRVVWGSRELACFHDPGASKPAIMIPNGVDRPHVRNRTVPRADWANEEAESLCGPCDPTVFRVGCLGAIDRPLDVDLLERIVRARPHWRWMMMGPTDRSIERPLAQHPNVLWLGDQTAQVVHVLMAGWDLAVWPYVGWSEDRTAVPPCLLDALAAGLPVVAPYSLALREWERSGVRLSFGPDGFLAACDDALTEKGPQARQRQERARRQLHRLGWSDLAVKLDDWLSSTLPGMPGSTRRPASLGWPGPDLP